MAMKNLPEIESVTKNDILKDPDFFKRIFYETSIVGFRGINLNSDEFSEVVSALGFTGDLRKNEDFKPRFESMWGGVGTGGEVPQAGEFYYSGSDKPTRQTFMFWHQEDLHKEHLMRVKSINMHTYTATPTTGALGFVDMHQAYLDLPDDWGKELHDARKLEAQVGWLPEGLFQHPHHIVKDHWRDGYEVFMAQGFNDDCEPPYFWDMDTVGSFTEDSIKQVNEWVFNYQVNPDNQIWWDWEQGDLLIFDAQRFSIAWSAGFGLGELVFDSIPFNGGYTNQDMNTAFTVKPYVVPKGHNYHG